MSDYTIITDSASDFPRDLAEQYHLHIIPTPLIVDGVDQLDGETIFPKEFYQKQRDGSEISTYHISQKMFEEHFRPYAERKEPLIYVCFSTGIAGTFNAARLAKEVLLDEYFEEKFVIEIGKNYLCTP